MTTPTNPLGEVIAEAMEQAGLSENQVALRTGISRHTLHRRIVGGGFKDNETYAIAAVLETRPSKLWALAEEKVA